MEKAKSLELKGIIKIWLSLGAGARFELATFRL